MRRVLALHLGLILLASLLVLAQGYGGKSGGLGGKSGGLGGGTTASGGTTFTQTQHVGTSNSCGATTTCTITATSTCSTCVGLIVGAGNQNLFISSISGAGTWVVPPGCQLYNGSIVEATSCAYNLSESSGTTSIVVTWNGTNSATLGLYYVEVSWTGTTPTLDTTGTHFANVSGSSQASPTLTLTGSSDFCVQGIASQSAPSAITGSYTGLTTMSAGGNAGGAYIVNTASGASVTWTTGAATESITNAICIQ